MKDKPATIMLPVVFIIKNTHVPKTLKQFLVNTISVHFSKKLFYLFCITRLLTANEYICIDIVFIHVSDSRIQK
jgi:hypothetical protein